MREGWTYKKLGEVAFYSTSRVSSSSLDETNYVGVDNLLKDRKGKIDSTVVPVEGNCIGYKCGDILVGNIRPYLKKIWLANNDGGASGDVLVIRANNHQELHPDFLYWALSNDAFFEYNMLHSKGAKMPRGNKVDILKYIVPVPPLSEQQSIVAELDKINELISLKKAQLSDLDSLAQSIFYDMFGDPIENEKGWEYLKLQTLIDNNIIIYHLDGNHGGDYPRSEEFVDRGVPYIGANCLNDGSVDFSLAKYLPKEKADKLRKGLAKNGDVLFAHNATVGPVAFLNTKEPLVILSTSLTAFRCNLEKMHPLFLRSYMQSTWFESQYKSAMKQTTRNQIPITKQKNMFFICPPLPLQQEFAKRIELIEQQKAQISSTIKDLETLLASRMQYWFD